MSYSDQEDAYCTDDAASVVSVDSEYAAKLRHNVQVCMLKARGCRYDLTDEMILVLVCEYRILTRFAG